MDLVPLDEQRQLFISPSIDEWKSIEDHGITAVIDLDGDLDLGIPNIPNHMLYVYFPRQGEAESSHDHGSRNIRHANHPKGRDAVLVALVAGTGLRIGEALAIRTDDFDPLCRLLQVRRSAWRRREQAPKTLNAIRPVDIPESLAQVLCRYIKGRKGHLFTTRAGRLLDPRNVLDVLQQAGRQGGYHAFRRFRFAVLR
jgi:integrase